MCWDCFRSFAVEGSNGKPWMGEWIVKKINVDLHNVRISEKCFPQTAAGIPAPASLLNTEEKYRSLFL
jgi:hypothetical protein